MQKKYKWVVKNSHSDSWTFQHLPIDDSDLVHLPKKSKTEELDTKEEPKAEEPKKKPKTEELDAKTQFQAALVREVMLVGQYDHYDYTLKPNESIFTGGQLDQILKLVVKLRRKKDKNFNPFIRPDYALDFTKISKELLDHLTDPHEFELTDNNNELQEILRMKSKYKRIVRDKVTNLWGFQLQPVKNPKESYEFAKAPVRKNKALTTDFRAKEEIQAAIARELEIIALPEVYDPNLATNVRNFSDDHLMKIVDLIVKIKKEKNKPFGPEGKPFGPDTDSEEYYFELAEMLHQGLKEPEDYELSDDNEEVQKILNSNLLPAKSNSLPAVTKPFTPALKAEERKLVDEAVVKIKLIYIKNAQQTYLDIADYLAETFFNNDIELIKAKKPAGNKVRSYNEVIRILRAEKIGAPSKSWMYNALDLFTDRKLLEQKDEKSFHTYGNLPVSHQIKLITVKDIDQKVKLINKTAKEKLTVIKLQQELDKLNKKKKPQNTYSEELKALEKYLEKRLVSVRELPLQEKKKIDDYTKVEEFLKDSIERVKKFLELDMHDSPTTPSNP